MSRFSSKLDCLERRDRTMSARPLSEHQDRITMIAADEMLRRRPGGRFAIEDLQRGTVPA